MRCGRTANAGAQAEFATAWCGRADEEAWLNGQDRCGFVGFMDWERLEALWKAYGDHDAFEWRPGPSFPIGKHQSFAPRMASALMSVIRHKASIAGRRGELLGTFRL